MGSTRLWRTRPKEPCSKATGTDHRSTMLAVSDLLLFPHPVLTAAAAPVTVFDDGLRRLAAEMLRVMPLLNGVGLAAPQIGLGVRLFVIGADGTHAAFVNPRITNREHPYHPEEGCLSLPGRVCTPLRHERITAEWQDLTGEMRGGEFRGLLAEIFEHETDHLNGTLLHQRPQRR